MRLRIYDPRILAIDLRHRRFGFTVFEGPRRLLAWGARVYPELGDVEAAMMGRRLTALLRIYSPSAIVVSKERWDRATTSPGMQTLENEIRRLADAHVIVIQALDQSQMRESFTNLGCTSRYEIASSLSRIFPDLAAKLPPARRLWEAEHSSMTIFDAAALGLFYWQHESEYIFVPTEQDVDIG